MTSSVLRENIGLVVLSCLLLDPLELRDGDYDDTDGDDDDLRNDSNLVDQDSEFGSSW